MEPYKRSELGEVGGERVNPPLLAATSFALLSKSRYLSPKG
jgi:hypothetical protein